MGSLFATEKTPLLCVPITGVTEEEIFSQLKKIIKTKPDVIEWRADFYKNLSKTDKVLQTIEKIKCISDRPLLFTIRSEKEGGEKVLLTEEEKVSLLQAVCKQAKVDAVDYEIKQASPFVEMVKKAAKEAKVELIFSYHNFTSTPQTEDLIKIAEEMARAAGDVAKIAVMPKTKADVYRLLDATYKIDERLSIPVITMSMGELGVLSRVIGWAYGSRLTFAVGVESSAPGQVPIDQLRKTIKAVQALTT